MVLYLLRNFPPVSSGFFTRYAVFFCVVLVVVCSCRYITFACYKCLRHFVKYQIYKSLHVYNSRRDLGWWMESFPEIFKMSSVHGKKKYMEISGRRPECDQEVWREKCVEKPRSLGFSFTHSTGVRKEKRNELHDWQHQDTFVSPNRGLRASSTWCHLCRRWGPEMRNGHIK